MSLLAKEHPQEIYKYFKTKLSKAEAIFLVGYYYFNNDCLTLSKDEFTKYKIIGQQFLTFAQTNPLSYKAYNFKDENTSLSVKDFYLPTDKINESINFKYGILYNDVFLIEDIEKCKDDLNQNLEQKLKFNTQLSQDKLDIINNNQIGKKDIKPDQKIPKIIVEKIKVRFNKKETSKPNLIQRVKNATVTNAITPTKKTKKNINRENFHYFLSKFKGEPKLLDFEYFSHDERTLLCKLSQSQEIINHKKYSGIWVNDCYSLLNIDELTSNLNYLAAALVENGIMFLSFPFVSGLIKDENDKSVSFNETMFKKYFKDNGFKSMKILEAWNKQYYLNKQSESQIKTFNVLIKKVNNANKQKQNKTKLEKKESKVPTPITVPKETPVKPKNIESITLLTTLLYPVNTFIKNEKQQELTIHKSGLVELKRRITDDNHENYISTKIETVQLDTVTTETIFNTLKQAFILNKYISNAIGTNNMWRITFYYSDTVKFQTCGITTSPVIFHNTNLNDILVNNIKLNNIWGFGIN